MLDFAKIKLVCIDVDGTLTDGLYQMSNDGILTKSFYTRDFYGIEQLLRKGLLVYIITQAQDEVIQRQLFRLSGQSAFWCGHINDDRLLLTIECGDKLEQVETVMKAKGWDWENVAYIGDAENDAEVMDKVAFAACPADAIEELKKDINYISDASGGRGAVYEIALYLLEKIGE